jgi:transcriptional regulator with XRE-family HTH domain
MSDMEATTLRTWLKNIRTEKNLTQSEIAKMAGVDVTMISKIELGERRPSVEVAKKIAAVLGFDWTRFYDDEQAASK